MNVPKIDMDRAAARIAYRQYLQLPKKSREDEEIMRGYRQLAKGTPLIRLTEVMRESGLDDKGLPKLAVCRADAAYCFLYLNRDGSAVFTPSQGARRWETRLKGLALPAGTFLDVPTFVNNRRAIVPIVPAHLRPTAALENFHILWEADWEVVPRDPLLLKKISDDLYAVLAAWDLTEVERAVLAKRVI